MKMTLTKKQIFLIFLGLIILGASFLPLISFAAASGDKFVPLAPFPYIAPPPDPGASTFTKFITNFLYINLAIGGILAVVYMMIGGLQYMTTDAMGGKEEGKERITRSLVGLLILISAWLILNTINPQLLSNSLTLDPLPPPEVTDESPSLPKYTLTREVGTLAEDGQCILSGTVQDIYTNLDNVECREELYSFIYNLTNGGSECYDDSSYSDSRLTGTVKNTCNDTCSVFTCIIK